MKYSIAEMLEIVEKQWGPAKKASKLQAFSSPQLKTFLDYTYNENITWLLPEGKPNYTPNNGDLANLRTKLFQEMDKLKYYLNIGPYPNLNAIKRQELFKTTLEVLHPKDAELLLYIKDNRKLPYKIPKEVIAEAFPIFTKNWKKIEKE